MDWMDDTFMELAYLTFTSLFTLYTIYFNCLLLRTSVLALPWNKAIA